MPVQTKISDFAFHTWSLFASPFISGSISQRGTWKTLNKRISKTPVEKRSEQNANDFRNGQIFIKTKCAVWVRSSTLTVFVYVRNVDMLDLFPRKSASPWITVRIHCTPTSHRSSGLVSLCIEWCSAKTHTQLMMWRRIHSLADSSLICLLLPF